MNAKKYVVDENKKIIDCLKILNDLGGKILFTCDKEFRITGSVTDGDIRRALISGYTLNDAIGKVANRKFKFITQDSKHNAELMMKEFNLRHIPLLDKEKRLIKIFETQKETNYLSSIAVLIMAGGKGTRLLPLTKRKPKPLLKIGKTSLIENIIDKLLVDGFKKIFVSINYKGDMIKERLKKKYPEIFDDSTFIDEKQFLGTAGSLHFLKDIEEETILVHNADILCDVDFHNVIKHHRSQKNDITSILIPRKIKINYGTVSIDKRRMIGIMEKPEIEFFILSGLNIVERKIVKNLKETFLNMDLFLDKNIKNKKKVGYYLHTGFWIDAGTKENYELINIINGG